MAGKRLHLNQSTSKVDQLLFRYAESYNILEDENKSLRSEIQDLKANLKINKEVIEGFFGCQNKKDKISIYINKLKEEISNLNFQNEIISEERHKIRSKVKI